MLVKIFNDVGLYHRTFYHQVFKRHVASDRMVSGAYKTEYGEADEIQEVADKIKVRLTQSSYSRGKSRKILRKVKENQGELGNFFCSIEKFMFS